MIKFSKKNLTFGACWIFFKVKRDLEKVIIVFVRLFKKMNFQIIFKFGMSPVTKF